MEVKVYQPKELISAKALYYDGKADREALVAVWPELADFTEVVGGQLHIKLTQAYIPMPVRGACYIVQRYANKAIYYSVYTVHQFTTLYNTEGV